MSAGIPPAATALIGVERSHKAVVTERDIHRFTQAIGAPRPGIRGQRGLIAPPLFFQALAYDDAPIEELPADGSPRELDVPVPAARAVGGSSDFEIFRYAEAGDEIEVVSKLRDVYGKTGRSGPLYFIVVETQFKDGNGELMARETATYIKRP